MQYKIRIATKQHERKIIEMAKKLKENPYMILPECRRKKCPFEKMKKTIEKFSDESFLQKAAKGKDLIAALAATILLADEKKIPYLAYKKIGNEDVLYAKRGKAKDEYLIAIQNWDKPNLRLLGYINFAKKKKVNLFSMPDKIICADEMPEEFVKFLKDKFECGKKEYIAVRWNGNEIKLCGKGNSLAEMGEYFYYPDFWKKASIDVHANIVTCQKKCEKCIIENELNKKPDPAFYVKGRQTDEKYIENYKNMVRWAIEKKKVFTVGGKCYGDDIEEILKLLNPKEWEKEFIREILEKERNAIILEQPSSAKLLQKYGINTNELKKKWEEMKKEKMLLKLPSVQGGKLTKFIDEMAKAYRVEGIEGIMKLIKERKLNVKEKAISYAFLLATNARIDEWKYSKMEKEFGKELAKHVEKVIKSEGKEYEEAVKTLAKMAGE